MSIFTSVPGYAGFYGPTSGVNVMVSFGRGEVDASKVTASLNNGFLCDRYDIRWQRPAQAKRFLNVDRPVAIVGFGNGQLTLTGLLGTYEGFESIIGDRTATTATDACNPLFCSITSANSFASCESGKGVAQSGNVQWLCHNLLLADINVTGQVQDNGVLFQQATVVFTMGGLKPERIEEKVRENALMGVTQPQA